MEAVIQVAGNRVYQDLTEPESYQQSGKALGVLFML